RWLIRRINTLVQREDEGLIESVQAGLATSAYGFGYLSEKEACLRQLHDMVRAAVPVASRPQAPAPGTVAAGNAAMGGRMGHPRARGARSWQEKVRRFVDEELIPFEVEAEMNGGVLPEGVRQRQRRKAKDIGLHALGIPREHGGKGLTALEQAV